MLDSRLTYVTPVYNGSDYIEELVKSVAEQRLPDGTKFQHIVVNDGSTDDTLSKLELLESQIGPQVVIVDKENGGEASAVNTGIAAVKTPYVCVVNADDPLLPGHGYRMVSAMDEHPEIAVAYPDWQMIDEHGSLILTRITKPFDERALIGDFVCLPGPGAVIRLADVEGPIRNTNYRYITDFELWVRLASRKAFLRVPHVLATWRQHSAGATATGSGSNIADELLRLATTDLKQLLSPESYERFNRSAIAHANYYAALQLTNDDPAKARRLILRSLAMKPYPNIGYATDHRNPVGIVLAMSGPTGGRLIRALGKLRARVSRLSVRSNQ